ncbi:diguanylate cyclase domain-containing protein [Kineococcus rubinsiae]|uniref:diguanylate cyclase domain-containing protein n=1 Tax=Kineococcus rubinsiae TaxID=2609562 RepID=UPI00142F7F90|nr:sensor domain-containing diguanylate cyclase [Kineococcus rubinsiae]NIZ90108.1 diguanylate cyclase [Kineococcus rubinsiae]
MITAPARGGDLTRPAQRRRDGTSGGGPSNGGYGSVRGGGPRLAVTTAAVVAVLGVLMTGLVGADSLGATVWWPAAGAALALAVRRPARRWWVVGGTLVGTVVAGRLVGDDASATAVFASAQALQCGVGASVVTLLAGGAPVRLRRGRDAWGLSAGAVAGILAAAPLAQSTDASTQVLAYVPTQVLGVLLVAPLLLLPVPTPPSDARSARLAALEWFGVLATAAGISATVFLFSDPGPWSFVVVVPLLWGSARLEVGRALSALLLVAVVTTAGTVGAAGSAALLTSPQLHVLQALLSTAGAVTLVMTLVVRSRERAVVVAGRREELFRRTFDDALLGVALLRLRADGSATVARVNDRLVSMLGTGDVVAGSDWADQVADVHRDAFVDAVQGLVEGVAAGEPGHWHAELQHGDGRVWLELAMAAWPTTPDGARTGDIAAVVQVADVTQRRLVQRRLREAALHDPLTGLPNRTLLEDRLRHALDASSRSGRRVALLYCDLDDFKPVNDTGGHAAGDHVLIGVAQRLTHAVRPGDTVARLGGDEFAVVCPDLPDEAAAQAVAQRVVDAMRTPFPVAGWSFDVGISVGLAMAELGADPQRVLQQADGAMYEAKGSGKGRVRAAGVKVLDLRAQPRTGS